MNVIFHEINYKEENKDIKDQSQEKAKTIKKSTIYLFSPVVRGRKGEYRKEIHKTSKADLEGAKLKIFADFLSKLWPFIIWF